jgi:hypothetical protein
MDLMHTIGVMAKQGFCKIVGHINDSLDKKTVTIIKFINEIRY